MKHTSGPWIAEGGNSKGQICISHERENDIVFIAGVEFPIHDNDNLTKEQAGANAQLIAAAPDLLEALADLCYCVGATYGKSHVYKVARAAIAKAIGEKEVVV